MFLKLLVFSVLVVIISTLSAFISLRDLVIRRSSRFQKMNVGNYFEDHYDIENKHFVWKQWLEIHDLSGISGNPDEIRVLANINAKKVRTFNTYTFLRKRGIYSLGPMRLIASDFFGFFEYSRQVENPGRLVVLPRIVHLDQFAHLPAYLSGGKELRVSSTETTPYASGVREYHPGDSLRRIHWQTTARKNRLMVKEFDRDPQMNTWIILDCLKSNHFERIKRDRSSHPSDYWSVRQSTKYRLPCSTFEYAVTAAASITRFYIEHKYGVGLITSGRQQKILVSDHGYRQLGRVLDTLAYIQADGEAPFDGFVGEYLKHINRGSTVILISTQLDHALLNIVYLAIARGLEPILINVERPSFIRQPDVDGKEGQNTIVAELQQRSIPVFTMQYEADIKECLENGKYIHPQGIPVG